MQVAKAVNNISESALSNSNKSIQFSQLQKVIQICMAHRKQQQQLQKKKKKKKKKKGKASTFVFIKATKSLVVRCREKNSISKKSQYENIFLKLLLIHFG